MYLTNTTDNVRNLFKKIANLDDMNKLEILMSIFNLINNNQINNKNEENPDLNEDNDLIIFNMENLGFTSNYCTVFLQYNLIMLYNSISKINKLYEKDGNIMGFNYSKEEKEIISYFEKLTFNEKLDVIAELIIRCDNETFLEKYKLNVSFENNRSGFDIAKSIINYKNNIN